MDTGSNISCIDYSLIKNKQFAKPKENIIIVGADNNELDKIGEIELIITINDYQYLIHAYVIKGLNCKLLLGNDFNIENNVVIDFNKKNIRLRDNIIPIDENWYNFNKNNITNLNCITSISYYKINSKETKTNNNEQNIISDKTQIKDQTKNVCRNKDLEVKTEILENNNKDNLVYNLPKLYTLTYKGIPIHNLGKTNGHIVGETNLEINENEITDKQGVIINISKDLNNEQKQKAKALIDRYKHLFTSDPLDINCAKVEPCEINLKTNKPVFQPPYRVSPTQREKLKFLIDQMIAADIVEPSRSNYAAPVFLIPKKEKGEYRFLVDYRKLNNETISDKHPIPRSQDLFRSLEGAKYYSTIDMAQGYFQIPIKVEDRYKTAFITDFGLYHFKRIPQGFKNSGPFFQRTINNIFSDYLYRTMVAYLDDICCFGKDFDSSLKRLGDIFSRLDEAGLKLKTNKCVFFSSKIELLGHEVSNNGIVPLEKNVEAIKNFPLPKKVKDVRSFIGLTSYYRKYIKNFAKIANPLTNLIKKEKRFDWGENENNAFNILKNSIITAPVLAHFEDEYPIFVTTDASIEGLSGILEQENPDGKRHPIAFASRKLKGGEKNYSTTELEMSAVVFALNYFKEYLIGRKVTVFSDHSSLQYYKTMKNPSSRITKFIFKLLEFDLEIKHKAGKWNLAADCLSRYPVENINTLITELKDIKNDHSLAITDINMDLLKEKQLSDDFCNGIINAIKTKTNSKYKKKSRQYCIKNELLYFKNWSPNETNNLLVIPKSLVNYVLKSNHESVFSAHFGVTKTLLKLKKKYYWPTIIQDTNQFIKACTSCQLSKNPIGKKAGLLQPIPLIDTKPISRLCFDYLGPLPISKGKKYLIVATCNATKMAFAKAVVNADAKATIDFLLDIITSYGTPKYFVSDRGTHFKNNEVSNICAKLGIIQTCSTSYHPQSNGMTELMNKIICNSLTHYVNNDQKDWALYYKMVVFAYNTTPHSRLGYSPFFLMFGTEANQPLDNKLCPTDTEFNRLGNLEKLQKIREEIPKLIKKEQDIQKEYYNKTHKEVNYQVGQKVLVKINFQKPGNTKKLAYKYSGPFKILEKVSEVNYKVDLIQNGKRTTDIIHVQRMKPFVEEKASEL